MTLKVIGAGLGRTGTHSLKIALERLLGAPCYHMVEVFRHPEHERTWREAAEGQAVNWHTLLEGYAAAVDWPPAAFYEELSQAFPKALVILSERDPEAWWNSAHATIFSKMNLTAHADDNEWSCMIRALMGNRFTLDIENKDTCIGLFKAHVEKVKATIPAERLLVWRAQDGWGPICERLNLPVPEEPFPLTNTKQEFLSRFTSEAPNQ